MLWGVWLTANLAMWMNDVAAAWLMTSMTTSPIWVALVQTAATLPVFLLGLPSGALADIIDRRRYFLVTQFWVAVVALLLTAAVLAGVMTPGLLLALVFCNGVGLAMRWPVIAAIMPEIVPRAQLPSALALNGVGMNFSRIVGPLTAGALITSLGSAYVFALNALIASISAIVIMRWRRAYVPDPLGRERLGSAMRVGLQFVMQSARLKSVLLRIFLFFFHSTGLLALLTLVARDLEGGGASTFTVLLAAMGAGAIFAAMLLPRVRTCVSGDIVVLVGAVVQAASAMVVATTSSIYIAVPAMFAGGMAWISTANSLSVSAQMALPDWVRARGMATYQMAIMGGSAAGAAVWGQVATVTSVKISLLASGVAGVVSMLVAHCLRADSGIEEDLTPSRHLKRPVADNPPRSGQIVVQIEYWIKPSDAAAFLALMQESRRSRLRQGAVGWKLLHDLSEPGRFVEQIVDASWTEHLRRFDRITAADAALRERKLAFHIGEEGPKVTRFVLEGG